VGSDEKRRIIAEKIVFFHSFPLFLRANFKSIGILLSNCFLAPQNRFPLPALEKDSFRS